MLARILIFVASVTAFPVIAATTSWEGYDLKNCKHWSMTPDDFQGSGPRFARAVELAKRANSSETNGGWIVVEGGILWEDGEPWYGVCRFESSFTILSCLSGADFPLSGATYKLVREKNADATFACIRDCDKTEIKMIIQMAYEEETVFSSQAVRITRRFENKCHDEAKRTRFFRLLHQQQKDGR